MPTICDVEHKNSNKLNLYGKNMSKNACFLGYIAADAFYH